VETEERKVLVVTTIVADRLPIETEIQIAGEEEVLITDAARVEIKKSRTL